MKANELKIGLRASMARKISAADIEAFAQVSGDNNPVHLNEEYAKGTSVGERIAHGMLAGSFVSAVLGNQLPGLGAIYLGQTFKFLKPVKIGDLVTAEVEVLSIDLEKNRAVLKTRCFNQKSEDVLVGEATILCPS
jgi:3-hydroxybutyryl-CoA dehydratase